MLSLCVWCVALYFLFHLLSQAVPHKYRRKNKSLQGRQYREKQALVWSSSHLWVSHLLFQSNMCCLISVLISICCLFESPLFILLFCLPLISTGYLIYCQMFCSHNSEQRCVVSDITFPFVFSDHPVSLSAVLCSEWSFIFSCPSSFRLTSCPSFFTRLLINPLLFIINMGLMLVLKQLSSLSSAVDCELWPQCKGLGSFLC